MMGEDEDNKSASKGAGKAGKNSRQRGQLRDPPSMAQLEPNVNEHDPKRGGGLDPEETKNILMLNAEEEYTEDDASGSMGTSN